jgi:nitrate reductase NapD
MPDGEYHVASFVVSTRPNDAQAVAAQINAMSGLEVHASDNGKLVVTAEAANVRELAELSDALEQIDSVYAVAPVYHEYQAADRAAGAVSGED